MGTLQTFLVAAKDRFKFLQEYGFETPEVQTGGYWAVLTYTGEFIQIEVHYEIGTLPWVVLGRLRKRGDHKVPVERLNLRNLAERSAGIEWAEWIPSDVPDAVLQETLRNQADALRRFGERFLRGDFADWPPPQA